MWPCLCVCVCVCVDEMIVLFGMWLMWHPTSIVDVDVSFIVCDMCLSSVVQFLHVPMVMRSACSVRWVCYLGCCLYVSTVCVLGVRWLLVLHRQLCFVTVCLGLDAGQREGLANATTLLVRKQCQ